MYIRKSIRGYKGKTYTNYVLVESVHTAKGPRQKTVCSLGDLSPRPRAEWLKLARKIEDALVGQDDLLDAADGEVADIVRRVRARRADRGEVTPAPSLSRTARGALIKVDPSRVTTERHREAGPVHVGHQFWQRLGLDRILRDCGLSATAQQLACAMALNRLIAPCSEHAMPDWIRRTALADILGVDFGGLTEDPLYGCSTSFIRTAPPLRRRWLRASAACSISTQRSISTISPRPTSRASVPATARPSAATHAITAPTASRSWSASWLAGRAFRSPTRCSPATPRTARRLPP